MSKSSRQKGYTLLFAVLTAVLVLGVAAFIAGSARKQYILSSTAKDSLFSLYNADTGVECVVQRRIDTPTDAEFPSITLSCANNNPTTIAMTEVLPPTIDSSQPGNSAAQFIAEAPAANQAYLFFPHDSLNRNDCLIIKMWRGKDKTGQIYNIVNSRGYNQCSKNVPGVPDGPIDSPRTVERAMQFKVQ